MKRLGFIITHFVLTLQGVLAQHQLTNTGNIMIHQGGNITFYGDLVNNGSYIDSGNVTTMGGTSAQNIGGSTNTQFKNLNFINNAGVFLSSDQSLIGELNISAGTFSTTGYDFKLVSNANGTARIAPILGDITGNITMERYIGPGADDWRFLASPVSSVTINDWQDDFITSGFPGSHYPSFAFVSIYTYDETVGGISDYGYNGAASSGDAIIPGNGYWCYLGPVPLTVDVTGPPVKFNHTFPVSNTPSGGSEQDGWVMIGNPYPCPIDWDSPSWSKTHINDAIYIWNPATQQYASWVSGVGVNGGSGKIASSQAFWIQTNGSNPALSCNENIKISSNTPFIRAANTNSFDMVKLTLNGNGYSDESIIRFGNSATKNYDVSLDSRKIYSSNYQVPGLSSLDSSSKEMSINSQPPLNAQVHIPVRTIVGSSGIYTLSVEDFPEGYCIVIEDLATNTKINLGIGVSYSFQINDTTSVPRFLLHASQKVETNITTPTCYGYSNAKITAKGGGNGPWNYTWYDEHNTLIKQKVNSNTPDTLNGIVSGSYFVQVLEINGICPISTSTIVVSQPQPIIAGFVSQSTLSVGQQIQIQNTSQGAVNYVWDLGDGNTSSLPVPQHNYSTSGSYVIQLIAMNQTCTDTVIKNIQVFGTTSLSENTLVEAIRVFPNPASSQINFDIKQKAQITVFNSEGKLLVNETKEQGINSLNIEHFSPGVYVYNILYEDGGKTGGKFIKE